MFTLFDIVEMPVCHSLPNERLVCLTVRPLNPLIANPTKWSNTLKQFVGNLPMNCLRVFDHFVILALKGLTWLLC